MKYKVGDILQIVQFFYTMSSPRGWVEDLVGSLVLVTGYENETNVKCKLLKTINDFEYLKAVGFTGPEQGFAGPYEKTPLLCLIFDLED
jgi:hypothetical protein